MLDFDEHDLTDLFVAAGFDVSLFYLHREGVTPAATPRNRERRRELARGMLARRANPTLPSYAEAAFAVLGEAAPHHLDRLSDALLAPPRRYATGVAYLVAQRPRREHRRPL
jgi:hypothetical protein